SVTRSENAAEVIVKIVNPSDKPYHLEFDGDWKGVTDLSYEYFAPGSLTVANSMENKNAVAKKLGSPVKNGKSVILDIDACSAGVLVIGLE
ncbi:MAG TPA: alpha-L-arabinofuranosidase, partial [Rikenellaceae bacterium]|nr:alpha-L-arabinofuranosidase [Rikenellaceae bacterium]